MDGWIVHDLVAAIRRKPVVAQCIVDGQQREVCDGGGGKNGVVAAVQSTIDACPENGVCGLGMGGAHSASNL